MTVAGFNRAVDVFARRNLGKHASKIQLLQQKILLQFLTRVVMRTPADTGRARANWHVTRGNPHDGWDDYGATKGARNSATRDAISSGAPEINEVTAYSVAWVTNNIPYIEALEEGHSKQAAAGGIVAVTLSDIESQFAVSV